MLFRYLSRHRLRCAAFLAMMIVSTVAYSQLVLNVSPLFDALMIGDLETVLPLFALMLFGLMGIRLVDYWAEVLSAATVNRIRREMKDNLFHGEIARLDWSAIDRDSGEFTADYTNDITMIEAKGLHAVRALASHIVSLIIFGYTLYTMEQSMLLPVLVSLLLCVVVPTLTARRTAEGMSRFLVRFDGFIQRLDDYFSGFALLKNYDIGERIRTRFLADNRETEREKWRAETRIEAVNALISVISWLMRVAVVSLGFAAALQGRLSVGGVIGAYTLAGALSSPIENMVRNFNEIGSIRAVERKIEGALKRAEEAPADPKPLEMPKGCPEIDVARVSVRLGETDILRNVSLRLESGGRYLIIGNNGSGKSTLAQAIMGIVPIASGRITIDGRALEDLSRDALGELISYSNEKVSLFDDTVANNLTFFGQEDSPALSRAVERASLEVPLEQRVGDGERLSSGEKRRLEIARALYRDKPVLIFDEVISTLDIATAYQIEKLILSLKGRTVVMISNAFSGSLLPEYDEIILMDSGRIAARGQHEALLRCSEAYRTLYEIRCGVPAKGDE